MDFSPLADHDPVPGDPDGVARLARRLTQMAERTREQEPRLRHCEAAGVWEGKAARAFRAQHSRLAPYLDQMASRCEQAGSALSTYVPTFGEAQMRVRSCVARAREANTGYWKADRGVKEMEAHAATAQRVADDWNAAHPEGPPMPPEPWSGPDWLAIRLEHLREFQAIKREFEAMVATYQEAESRCRAALEAADAIPMDGTDRLARHRVDHALDTVRSSLDTGGWGVRHNDLVRIRKALEGLDQAELDALFAQLTDKELDVWLDQLKESKHKGGMSGKERREVLNALAESASLTTIERLSQRAEWVRDYFRPDFEDTEAAQKKRLSDAKWTSIDELPFVTGQGERASSAVDDVTQGLVGDCYLLAGLAAVSIANPGAIRDMVQTNPNGTYTVTFHDGDEDVEIVVTPDFLTGANGAPVFAQPGDGGEVWTMVVEKAYAQWHGDFEDIEGGWPHEALEQITGERADRYASDDFESVAGSSSG